MLTATSALQLPPTQTLILTPSLGSNLRQAPTSISSPDADWLAPGGRLVEGLAGELQDVVREYFTCGPGQETTNLKYEFDDAYRWIGVILQRACGKPQ